MAFAAAEGESGLTYTLCLDPTPCEVCKAGPCGGALDVVTLPTSEEHGASNLRRKATGLQTKASTPEPWEVYQEPMLRCLWRDQHTTSACMADNLLSPGGGGGVLKKRELDLTVNMLVYLGQQSLL